MELPRRNKSVIVWAVSVVLIFAVMIVGIVTIAQRTSQEMFDSAIQSLNENLNLMKNAVDAVVDSEVEFQELIGQEIALADDPEAYIQTMYIGNAIAKVSVVMGTADTGMSSDGQPFFPDKLTFAPGAEVEGCPVSQTFVNDTGTWAYTIASPLTRNDTVIGTLYIEYAYDAIADALPKNFYGEQASFYLMDAGNERFVVRPDGAGDRNAGSLNLEDFQRANDISDTQTLAMIDEGLASKQNVLFAHEIRGQEALCFLWPVNGGTDFLVGYVPMEAIQKEVHTVNYAIVAVTAITFICLALCVALYAYNRHKQRQVERDREAERAVHQEQLAEALRAAEVANESKSAFLANMSHDIRTPMNAVIGFTTLLLKDTDNPAKVRDYAQKILASGNHLLDLINDVLDISKIESGKATITLEKFNLDDSLQALEAIVAPLAAEKKQHLRIKVDHLYSRCFIGDETHLNQVLINLLSNAVKYTPEGGYIDLRFIGETAESPDRQPMIIEVEDTGYGMTPEFLEHVFDTFSREENSTTKKIQGTGLGLAITKNLVELMGGTIEVQSTLGKGSLFRVKIELGVPQGNTDDSKASAMMNQGNPDEDSDAELSALEGVDPTEWQHALVGKHFLAAEDNAFNMALLEELLESEGATVEIVDNGRRAVERMEQVVPDEFDAVLMDIQMPVMNGHDATRAIRTLPNEVAQHILIIAMTADAFVEDKRAAIEAGMDYHIAKPIELDRLKKIMFLQDQERKQ